MENSFAGRGRSVLALRRPRALPGLCAVPHLSPGATANSAIWKSPKLPLPSGKLTELWKIIIFYGFINYFYGQFQWLNYVSLTEGKTWGLVRFKGMQWKWSFLVWDVWVRFISNIGHQLQ